MIVDLLQTIVLASLVVGAGWLVSRYARPAARPGPPQPEPAVPSAIPPSDETYGLIGELNNIFSQALAHPSDLDAEPRFHRLAAHLDTRSNEDLLRYVHGSLTIPACAALEVLRRRRDDFDPTDAILRDLNDVGTFTRAYALRAIQERATKPVLAPVFGRARANWNEGILVDALRDFVRARLAWGESPDVFRSDGGYESEDDDAADFLPEILERLGEAGAPLLESWTRRRNAGAASGGDEAERAAPDPGLGRTRLQGPLIDHEALRHVVERLVVNLTSTPPRASLLVGDPLVGKTTTLQALARRLRSEGWRVDETSAADLIAGQSYVGQVEARLKGFLASLQAPRALWIVPDITDLLWAGRHSHGPAGILEMILPHVESGRIRVVGEIRTSAFDRLLQEVPRLRTAIERVDVNPLGDAESMALARAWAAQSAPGSHQGAPATAPPVSEEVLRETLQLAKTFAREGALPGSLLQILQVTRMRMISQERAAVPIGLEDVLATLSGQTGIPAAILDERHGLDLAALRAFFDERIFGQNEAVDCLVERVAMIKAGLVDPSRPAGVFLFVGPTGTGKTAVAKALAEYLFGSPDRMIRLDMSEFQTEESLTRVLGSGGPRAFDAGGSLAQSIRNQPFSVVLLDEFEKAHPRIWDLFLQVFDDGRLTDRWGQTADFRHAIIILTSNLGAVAGQGAGIGFSATGATYSAAAVERGVESTFRPEFINRIDRVVVFKPLHRAVMRQLLEKELRGALRLRGLRTRDWAVEWDEGAVDFLLERGFSSTLGARPLKRAIERYFLSPLSETIVSRRYPEGDQFVFVHADGERLAADFVDPDAPDGAGIRSAFEDAAGPAAATTMSLRRLARGADCGPGEIEFLDTEYRRLEAIAEGEEWAKRKQTALASMAAAEFWESPERFRVLGLAEYMDRIEAGLKRAGALLQRLGRHEASRPTRAPRDLVQRLAHQIYLLDAAHAGLEAGQGRDAYVLIEASRDSQTAPEAHDRFGEEIAAMYRGWARARGMRLAAIDERPGDARQPWRALLDVSGYAAYPILAAESGMHVLESPEPDKGRARAYVFVLPQRDGPEGRSRADVERRFRESDLGDAARRTIVRRYRREPAPLVRDAVRGWRTGRLDLVLSGQFDLME